MEQFYTSERNVQIVIGLLKAHGIKRIVASPGSTNVTFVGSVQQDSFFEIYSCVDERSASYMAVGIALETGEPCVLSCTGATASRNYFSALTEAFYRKIPILAITSTQEPSKIGNLTPQVIDRSVQPNDIVKISVQAQTVKDKEDEWDVMRKVNQAILELDHHGKGPVHIDLVTRYSNDFSIKELPNVHKIMRYTMESKEFPEIKDYAKIAIYVGSHRPWNKRLTELVDRFCEVYNAVVFSDTVANYTGKYRMNYTLVNSQREMEKECNNPDLAIHIGDMSDEIGKGGVPKHTWRVSEDGLLSDRFHTLDNVFEMSEENFFDHYTIGKEAVPMKYYEACQKEIQRVYSKLPEIPFSHIWVASKMSKDIPQNSVFHLGILSPLRSWSYFDFDNTIELSCNQGGFGIDGNMSTLVGASQLNKSKLYFVVVGDLSFFYDLNVLGNRHFGENIRILLINNSLGAEFHLFKQKNSTYVKGIDRFISAGGHNGCQSPVLVKHIAEDLGFEYLTASSKTEFEHLYKRFVTPTITERPMIFEVFTKVEDENQALYNLWHIVKDSNWKQEMKETIKGVIGDSAVKTIKKFIK